MATEKILFTPTTAAGICDRRSGLKLHMIYITQLIYIRESQEKIFDEFESLAIPMISKYNGRLLFRLRANKNDFIEHHVDLPYEIHLVEFREENDFNNFMHDEERKNFLHLKEQSIRSSVLIKGSKM